MSSSQSRPLSPQPPSPDLTTIAAVLTEAAQAIQGFSDKKPPQRDDTTSPILSGETRCYHLSAATLKRERDLLKRYRADDFQGLLVEAHTLLTGLVKLMKSTHPDARLRGHSVSSLGSFVFNY